MQKIIDKRNYIILVIIILLLVFILIQMFTKKVEYSYNYEYFNHYIVVKIYEDKDIRTDVDEIYKKYEAAINGKNDKLLKEVIAYGKDVYKKTAGYVDISKGSLVNNSEEKFVTKIDELDENMTSDLEVSDIISGYATNDVIKYLKSQGIDEYLISDDGDISVGNYYTDGKYKASISYEDEIIDVASFENESMVTRNKTSEDKSYMFNPIENKITKKYDSVVVIASNINEATFLADAIYLMDRKEGEKLIKKYEASALWYNNGKTYTLNFDKYIGD